MTSWVGFGKYLNLSEPLLLSCKVLLPPLRACCEGQRERVTGTQQGVAVLMGPMLCAAVAPGDMASYEGRWTSSGKGLLSHIVHIQLSGPNSIQRKGDSQ